MARYLILAQSEVTAKALNAWLELLGERILADSDPGQIVWDSFLGQGSRIESYESLVWRIEEAARRDDDTVPLNEVVVLVDSVSADLLNVLDGDGGWTWDSLVAALILTFPEIRWVFGDGAKQFEGHEFCSLLPSCPRRDPLFDPTGLREWVRKRANDHLCRANDDLKLPSRPPDKLAAAMDEEKPYAFLHGYTAYRFGCRTDMILTWALMEKQFDCWKTLDKTPSPALTVGHGYWLLLEDMSLNFPDRPVTVHLHCLKSQRAKKCRRLDSTNDQLETSDYRILVTTGQTHPGDPAYTENRAYLRHEKKKGTGGVVLKPASGMFDLWFRAGLFRKMIGTRRRGDVEGFVWPPNRPDRTDAKPCAERVESENSPGHGAPGKLMLVAEILIRRAEKILGKVESVDQAVQGAVLATDALELTGGRTPTTAIEALSLKHRFEVMAECQFSGVEYHIQIKPRIEEIALEAAAISRWFHSSQRESAMLNAQMHILNQLVGILRQYNQFDEEQICMARVRKLHTSLWMRAHSWRWVFWPFVRYVELLLSSFLGFVGMVALWLLALTLLFAWVGCDSCLWGPDRLLTGFQNAVTSFFSVGPPLPLDKSVGTFSGPQIGVISLSIISGFLHLGVMITHLYSVVSRK